MSTLHAVTASVRLSPILVLALGIGSPWAAGDASQAMARRMLEASAVKGGLVIHLGCGNGKLTAALRTNDSYLVHGLDTDAGNVARARAHIRSLGIYGKVSVDLLRGDRLPYADNLINLLVSEDLAGVPMAEVMRVLVPRGVAHIKRGGKWTKTVKPWPDDIDEWTHFLHDASNNAVARDTVVGPPRHMQWVAKPLYSRSHEIDSSISALVSARGRIFYILDEGLPGITDERLPAAWSLVARDAFNSVPLWQRLIPRWGWREWKRAKLEGKDWTRLRGQRGAFPATCSRRLVAQGDRVYVTLGYVAPLTILDAATGKTLRTCKGTEGTDEIVCSQGALVVRVRDISGEQKRRTGKPAPESLIAMNADTGDVLWRKQTGRILALSLAIGGDRVFFNSGRDIVCLDLSSGDEVWRTRRGGGGTFVVHKGVVLIGGKKLDAFSAKTGKRLWAKARPAGRGSISQDLFVADGLVWQATPTPGLAAAKLKGRRRKSWNSFTGAVVVGFDPMTGEAKRKVELANIVSPGHHFRCHRSKATERFILWPKRGVEFIDLKGDDHMKHDWLRAPCKLGMMPCNGLLYVGPHQCFCYPGVKLGGFNALAPARPGKGAQPKARAPAPFVRGPAYSAIQNRKSRIDNPLDWATFRHDPKRSGSTGSRVPAALKRLWQSELGGRLSQPVVAGGRLFVASVDNHTVHALDATNGKRVWTFTAGGRVDSPPTIYQGLVLFGSADGWVYCLRASDGKLAWRFRAAPEERRVIAFGQLESAWPVHGSVLVKDGVVYCAAGRSSYLDGGIYVHALDPRTGKRLHAAGLEGPYPDLTKEIGRPFDMEGTMADVLVTDGTHIYMQQAVLTDKLAPGEAPRVTNLGDRKMGRHLFSTAGLLDDTWWNRTFWMYSERWPGFYLANQAPKAGQLLVFDETTTYGVKVYTRRNVHSAMFFPGTDGYLLFADDNDNEPVLVDKGGKTKPVQWLPYEHYRSGRRGKTGLTAPAVDRDKGVGFTRVQPPKWTAWAPIRIRAMVLAGQTLFIAGPPDVLDPNDPLAAFEGRKGGALWAVSPADGKKLAEYKLDSPPVFDGMIAANGRLYVSTRDGRVLCMGGSAKGG